MATSSPIEVRTITSEIISPDDQSLPICSLTSILLVDTEELLDLLANLAIGNLDIVLGNTVLGHERQEVIVRDIQLTPYQSNSQGIPDTCCVW